MKAGTISRRTLLKGTGALVVSFSLSGAAQPFVFAAGTPAAVSPLKIPDNPNSDAAAQLELTPSLDSWIRIGADGKVTFFTGRVEIGNGILTALTQIVAEELDVPFDRVSLVSADTAVVPNQGITSATTTIGSSANATKQAAATARHVLLTLAGQELNTDVQGLQVSDGVVSVKADPSRQISYGALIGGKQFKATVDAKVAVKSPADYRIVGKSFPRLDIPRKLTAAPGDFQENTRLAGMRFARILRPPAYGAKLKSYDETVAKTPGIVAVLPIHHPGDPRLARVERYDTMPGDFIAVVAEREDQALRAVETLRKTAQWETDSELPTTSDGVYDWLTANGKDFGLQKDYARRLRDYEARLADAGEPYSATYRGPFLCYGPISPAWSLADVQGNKTTVYSATQWPFGARWMVAQALGYDRVEQVQVRGGSSSGLYGRRDDYDQEADVEAAILSQAVGSPVRLQWSRSDEFVWGQYRPPQIVGLEAGLKGGQIAGLQGKIWTTVRGTHPVQVIAAMALENTPYQVGAMPLAAYDAGPLLRTGYMRNVYSGYNIFALESFMDELAARAKADPVEFRLKHLKDERAKDVINAAVQKAGWPHHVGSSGRGIGISFVLYSDHKESSSTYMAYIAEVAVDRTSGAIKVKKLTCAIDPGLVVNPDGVKNQVEGGVNQALSWCLHEQVIFDHKIVTSHDWATYPILTFPEVPEIDVVIVDRPDQPAKGIGEPVTVPVASAVANAISDAVGARLRQLPLTPDQVKAALSGG